MQVAIVGAGNMGGAIALGLLRSGMQGADVHLVDSNVEKANALAKDCGFTVHSVAGEWLSAMDVLVLAVKPQGLQVCCEGLAPFVAEKTHVLSIAAGVGTQAIARWLKHKDIVRAMPNTPALVSKGITGLFAPKSATQAGRDAAQFVLGAVSKTFWVEKEEDLHVVTGGSGSGPAYLFLFMEAFSEALERRGFPSELAREDVLRTVEGAAALARESGEPFSLLREKVTSKGGTTAKALEAFAAGDFKGLVEKAVDACVKRSEEMGKDFA